LTDLHHLLGGLLELAELLTDFRHTTGRVVEALAHGGVGLLESCGLGVEVAGQVGSEGVDLLLQEGQTINSGGSGNASPPRQQQYGREGRCNDNRHDDE
jgi:hypothetical protein